MNCDTVLGWFAGVSADSLQRWPGRLIENYGLTRVVALACWKRVCTRINCIRSGGLRRAMTRLIDDQGQGRELPPDSTGEVAGHSEGIMTGYHKQPERTAEAEWHDAADRRFIRTGDVARFDDDGFPILTDRKKPGERVR